MSRTIRVRRHPETDGVVPKTLGRRGLAVARREGFHYSAQSGEYMRPFYIAHSAVFRACQAAMAFVGGLHGDDTGPIILPAIAELGNDELFRAMSTDDVRELVKAGIGHFRAIMEIHGRAQCIEWAIACTGGIQTVRLAMDDGTVADVFTHSPVVELITWMAIGLPELTEMHYTHQQVGHMEGIVLEPTGESRSTLDLVRRIACSPLTADDLARFAHD